MRIPLIILVSLMLILSIVSLGFVTFDDINVIATESPWFTTIEISNESEIETVTGCVNPTYLDNVGVDCYLMPNGSLLAIIVAGECGDFAGHGSDIYLKYSYDNGLTWGGLNTSAPFIDNITDDEVINGYGAYGGDDDKNIMCAGAFVVGSRFWIAIGVRGGGTSAGALNFLRYSDDNGHTWSQYINVSEYVWDLSGIGGGTWNNYGFVCQGGSGYYLDNGRAIMPGWFYNNTLTNYDTFVFYSDNITEGYNAGWSTAGCDGTLDREYSEWTLIQLENGTLWGNHRDEGKGTGPDRRFISWSTNNGSTWTDPPVVQLSGGVENVMCPETKGHVAVYTSLDEYNTSRILMAWNNNTASRSHLTVALSYDNCYSFVNRTDFGGSSYYQYPHICVTDNKSILVTQILHGSSGECGADDTANGWLFNLQYLNASDELDPIGGDPGGEYNPSVINEMGYSGQYGLGNESVMVGSFYINWTWDTNGTPSYHWINISNSSGFSTLYKNFNVSHAGVVEGSYCNYTITTVTASTTKRYIHIRSFYE